jgi:NTP pyrophosphatase (non-canonical NTP hydrolase)
MTPEQIGLLQQAVVTWGRTAQVAMMKEECLELALELQRMERQREDRHKIVDEIADVIIMMEQAKIIFGEALIQSRIDFKMERLRQRLEKAEEKYCKGNTINPPLGLGAAAPLDMD